MSIFKNIVAKLWMTIIALVAVVLLILGLFLFQYIDTSFPKANDQSTSLKELAGEVAAQAQKHHNEPQFVATMNDLLSPQDAGLILLTPDPASQLLLINSALFLRGESNLLIDQVFNQAEIDAVFAGKTLEHRKGDFLFIAVPVQNKESADLAIKSIIIVHQSQKSVESTQLYVKKLFALVSLIGFLLTTFFAFFLITKITKPLQQLKKAADLITHGEYGSRVPIVSSDELGELAQTFNLMGERLEETIKDLNYEKENLSSVLRSMADAVISFNVKGDVIFTNPHGEDIIANWRDIQWNTSENDTAENPDDFNSNASVNVMRSKQIPEPLQQIFANVVQDTKEITSKLHVHNGVWSIVIAPLYSRELVRGAVAVLRNVTEEHRLEKLRKDFVANVSHELRTPLSMLQGYSEALLDDIAASPEERTELAQVIYDESLRMGRLVKDLLDLARMETGHLELNYQAFPLNALLKRVHRKFNALCKEQGLLLVLQCPEDDIILPHADEDRLEQVLTNLLDNAIRHTALGAQITMRLGLHHSGTDNSSALIEIEDQGQGIPPEDLPFIFERFYKADKARTRGTTTGTGLGLAIVKNIVDSHHGTVQVKSTLGQGTIFSIYLPI
ncbi:HAMP domain-containing protein [Paenibacillus psychroresistens]|uniref:histidine kinase n=1 Tax=Paenibacillus psychroresistens TaxID=1778678 RepID=A0A6B8RLM4_9BACL|nr:ATP-binding protein [Paenibacillus psychroresistens]QGQ96919.1 HAMP domain-containing protein [Paenibacillus psychroresistens]